MAEAAHLYPKHFKTVMLIKMKVYSILIGQFIQHVPVQRAKVRPCKDVLGILYSLSCCNSFNPPQFVQEQVIVQDCFPVRFAPWLISIK